MQKPEYPQWARRERILWAVHEWCEDRTDARTPLHYHELVGMVADEAYTGTETGAGIEFDSQEMDRAHARILNLFVTLVREGYIDADVKGSYKGGPPFSFAIVRGLSERGLRAIQEMPDPNEQVVQRLDAIAEAIRGLQNIPEEEKKSAIDATEELKHFSRGLPPAFAIELGKAMLGG